MAQVNPFDNESTQQVSILSSLIKSFERISSVIVFDTEIDQQNLADTLHDGLINETNCPSIYTNTGGKHPFSTFPIIPSPQKYKLYTGSKASSVSTRVEETPIKGARSHYSSSFSESK